jgi:hypothetical protein
MPSRYCFISCCSCSSRAFLCRWCASHCCFSRSKLFWFDKSIGGAVGAGAVAIAVEYQHARVRVTGDASRFLCLNNANFFVRTNDGGKKESSTSMRLNRLHYIKRETNFNTASYSLGERYVVYSLWRMRRVQQRTDNS